MGDYKRKFEKAYDVIIPKGFEIHHINLDHEDDNLLNLMVLPQDLHREYHRALQNVQEFGLWKGTSMVISNQLTAELSRRQAAQELLFVLERCSYWADYTLYLQGKLPNQYDVKFFRRSDPDVRR